MGMTRKYWKGLEELKETPEFIKHKEQELIKLRNYINNFE